jgi:glycosyltransferase involved in cell wall biosynthesis
MALSGAPEPAARQRILLLTPRWPWPVNGGDRLRLLRLAEALAGRSDIDLLCLCQTRAELMASVPDGSPFREVHRVHLPRWRSWWNMLLALGQPAMPLQVAYYRSRAFEAAVGRQLALHGHDLLGCHLARMAPYGLGHGRPCWVELTDAVSLTMERAARLARTRWDPRAWLYALEARRMRAFERSLAGRSDLVSLISPVDAGYLFPAGDASRSPVVVAPNGVTLPAGPLQAAGLRGASVALLGRMDSLANRDALWFFVDDVWPAVRAAVPSAQLHVVGHVRPADARKLRERAGVTVHGVVARLSAVLGAARVGVCPVRFGAGMQNKLLDYLAHGCAAVTTPVGLEGLDARPGEDLRVARNREEWVEEVVRLLGDDRWATAVADAGRLVAQRHGWAHALSPLVTAIDTLLRAPSSTSSQALD